MKNLLALLLLSFITLADDKGHESLMATLMFKNLQSIKHTLEQLLKLPKLQFHFF